MLTSHKHTHLLSGSRRRVWVVLGMTGLLATLGLLIVLHGRTKQAAVAVNGEGSSVNKSGVQADAQAKARAVEAYGKLPMRFEANKGQTDAEAKFIARGRGYTLFLTSSEAVLNLKPAGEQTQSAVLRMKLAGANAEPQVAGLDELPGRSNYFVGSDSSKWQIGVAQYAKVKYEDVYPGINVVYYGNQSQLEYDFVAAPGADPKAIRLAFDGAERMRVDENGDLLLSVAGREVRQHKPFIYQEVAGERQQVAGRYVITGEHEAGFEVEAYDATRTLVIDPVLSYSAIIGGNTVFDFANGIAVDPDGFVYITGHTDAPNFPTTKIGPNPLTNPKIVSMIYVAKLNQAGNALLYASYFGGENVGGPFFPVENEGNGIAVDAAGNAYVVGTTNTTDFPKVNALPAPVVPPNQVVPCPIVAKVSPNGSALLYSTYLAGGGTGSIIERGTAITVCEPGVAVVTGYTNSLTFPTTPGAYQTQKAGSALPFPDNILSQDAFVSLIDTNRTGAAALRYSTYLGGGFADRSGADEGLGIAADLSGNIYVTGDTRSTDFPVTANAYDKTFNGGTYDSFLVKLCPLGKGQADLLYSTYLGGTGDDEATSIAIDGDGNAYLTGHTSSEGAGKLPVTPNAFQSDKTPLLPGDAGAVGWDVFVAKIATNTAGAAGLKYLTYLGTSGDDFGWGIAVDCAGRAYVTGTTEGTDPTGPDTNTFPVTAGAFDTTFNGDDDAFLSIIDTLSPTAAGSLVYSTYIGGNGIDDGFGVALDAAGNIYVVGEVEPFPGPNPFPTTAFLTPSGNYESDDVFVVKFAGNPAGSCNSLRVPSDQKAGSLLFFNLYSSNPNNPALENTRINITNTNPDAFTYVHLFFVDGSNCSVADSFVCLTPNQTLTVLASDVDPGVMGYVIAVATDENGCPANFNYLIGDEYVKLASGHEANLGAEAISAFKGCIDCKGGTTAQLRLNGINYSLAPRVLALDNIPSQTEGNSTLLVLNRVGGDLTTSADRIGSIFGLLYDDLENSYSFTQGGLGCQLKQTFNNSTFPRTTPRINQVIPAGHSGWMKLWGVSDIGLLGAMINYNPSSNVSAGAFNQGHNLHKLTLTNTAVLTIPVFPPHCS